MIIRLLIDFRMQLRQKEGYNSLQLTNNKRLDIKIQERIRNDVFWKYHNNKVTIKELKIIKEKIEKDCIKLLNGKDARISLLEKNMEETIKLLQEKKNEIEVIKNSTSWKITKPIRAIRKLRK